MKGKLLNTLVVPIRWVDCDMYGHVNNAKYFDYMTESRTRLLKEIINDVDNCQFILADTGCNFKRPYNYLYKVIIKQFLDEVGNCSMSFKYNFFSENDPGVLYAEGTAKIVCYDPKAKRVIKIPTKVRELLEI